MFSVLLLVLQDAGFQFVVVGARKRKDNLLVFDKHKGRHGRNAILHGDVFAFVYVNLKPKNKLYYTISRLPFYI